MLPYTCVCSYLIISSPPLQLIWKFVASEEDYVSQLTVLTEEFHRQCEIGARSCNPPLTLDQCDTIFRNRYFN